MFTRFNKSLIAIALVAGGVTAAQADGLYVGGSVGAPNYSNAINGIGGNGGGSGPAVNLYGGYQISPHVAVEAGAYRLGSKSDGNGTVKSHGVYLDGVGTYEIAPKLSLLGRIGVAEARFTTTGGDDSSPGIRAGAGLEYELTPQMSLRAEYDRTHYTNAFDAKPNTGEYAVGLKVGF